MNDKLRAKRDGIEKGDTVLVVWPGGIQGKQPRRGTVKEVMRAAVRIVFDDDHVERVVQLKYVKKVEEEIMPQPLPPPRVASILQLPTKPAEPPAPADDVQAWLDMGASLISQLEGKVIDAELRATALRADSEALLAEANAELHLVASLKDKLTKLRNIAGRK